MFRVLELALFVNVLAEPLVGHLLVVAALLDLLVGVGLTPDHSSASSVRANGRHQQSSPEQ